MKNINSKKEFQKWIDSNFINKEDKTTLAQMDDNEIANNFGNKLSFGTAGIRRHMGLGTSLLNQYTIKMIAYAWIKSLKNVNPDLLQRGLIVAHDTRNNGVTFSWIVANVISGMGYKVYLYKDNDIVPTPLVSYTIRKLHLGGGACITASHNPPMFNGFKCFNYNGQHLMDDESLLITNELEKIDINFKIPFHDHNLEYLDEQIITNYLQDIKKIIEIDKNLKKDIKIVFSPQHGAGYKLGPRILEELGFKVYKVKKQSIPDGNFPHTPDPNPENHLAFNEMIALGNKIKADVLLTTDPDADRIAIGIPRPKGYYLFNGHEMASIIVYYYLFKMKNKLNNDTYLIKTIVTTDLIDKIAQKYNVKVKNTLTGYKYIGNLISQNPIPPILVSEESYGCSLCPTISLDKDAIQLLPIVAEAVQFYRNQGKDLWDVLNDIYNEFGYYIHYNEKLKLEGKKAREKLNIIIDKMSKMQYFGDFKIHKIKDFRKLHQGFHITNLVIIYFVDNSWIALRPSGTEPLIRKYFCIKGLNEFAAKQKEAKIRKTFSQILNDML